MKKETGLCPICQKIQPVKNGRMGEHPSNMRDTASPPCGGVGQPPFDSPPEVTQ